MITAQEILGGGAAVIGILVTVIYVRSIFKRQSKPHFYTWLVFSILTAIAFVAQLADNAGPGAWAMGVNVVGCSLIMLLSLKYGEKSRTKTDHLSLFFALSAIVPWLLTKDPLFSVIMISMIDGVAMIPTIRKSITKPWDESLTSYSVANVKTLLSLMALTNFTIVTMLYSVSILFVNTTLIVVCLYQRRTVPRPVRV